MQSSVNDEKSFAKNLLTSLTEIGTNLFSTLETHCKMAVDGHKLSCRDTSLVQEPCKILCEQLNNSVAFLESPDAQSTMEKELTTGLYCSDYKVVSRLHRFSSYYLVLFFALTLGYTILLSSFHFSHD